VNKIKNLSNKKIDNKIKKDLNNFQKINKKNKICVMPDIHKKKGEMSPTGCVLISDNIVPSFTHLCVGSGISGWEIEVEKNFDIKKFDKLFKFLQKKIPGRNSKNLKIHNFKKKELVQNFKIGALSLVKQKILKREYLKNIESNGNFLNFKNYLKFEDAVPNYLKNICYKNFGTLGTGNTFIELHEIKKEYFPTKNNKKKLFIFIHSGISDAYLTMFFSPRWGLHGEKFLPFEKEKWNYFSNHLVNKDSIITKKKFFPNSSKYFDLDPNSYDGRLFMSAMAYLCNMSICNRLYIGSIVEKYINENLKVNKINLIWDSIHDSIKYENINNSKKIIHRHGAAPIYGENHINKFLNKNKNYKNFIIPSFPGGETLVGISKRNFNNYFNSICHGTGRKLDRPVARKKFSHNQTQKLIESKIHKFYFKMENLAGENPKSFRNINDIIKILDKKKLIEKKYLTKPVYILKS